MTAHPEFDIIVVVLKVREEAGDIRRQECLQNQSNDGICVRQ